MLSGLKLTQRYGAHTVLESVSLAVEPGRVTAILGPNGAGKTTLLNCLTGGGQPSEGEVTLDGKALSAYGSRELACRRAVLPQSSSLGFNFTVREVVEMGRLPHIEQHERARDSEIVNLAMLQADIQVYAHRHYLTLSGGEKQRVHLARVLAQVWPNEKHEGPPRYLFLDEPTNNLDLAHQHRCLALARRLANAGLGVCAILHDLNLALRYADQFVLLQNGRLRAYGLADEVMTPEIISEVFSVKAQVVDHAGHKLVLTEPA